MKKIVNLVVASILLVSVLMVSEYISSPEYSFYKFLSMSADNYYKYTVRIGTKNRTQSEYLVKNMNDDIKSAICKIKYSRTMECSVHEYLDNNDYVYEIIIIKNNNKRVYIDFSNDFSLVAVGKSEHDIESRYFYPLNIDENGRKTLSTLFS